MTSSEATALGVAPDGNVVETPILRVRTVDKVNSLSFVRAMLSCYEQGIVAMPVEPGRSVDVPGIIVADHAACDIETGWFRDRALPRSDDAPAQISLTSGTTGQPKPILLSHRALGDTVDRLIAAQGLDETIREYVGVPVTFSFGFGRIRTIAAVGGESFLPPRGFRVDELARMLERGEVNSLSAVPTLLRVALANSERLKPVGHKLRWLEIGSQSMSLEEKQAIKALFPNARIVQHYGLTEASRTTFLHISEEEGDALASVGRPSGEVEIKLSDEGLIAIRGPHVADGIVSANGVLPLKDVDGWLVTRDLGRFDPDGRLVFEGRADHLLNVAGVKVPAELFEEKLLQRLPPNTAVAVAGGADDLRGELVVVAHEASVDRGALEVAALAVASDMGIADGFALLPVSSIARTETNKVRRGEITAAFARAVAERPAPAPVAKAIGSTAANPRDGVVEAFVAIFGERARNEGASFASLGGDSLNYVTMLMALEDHVPDLPDDWDEVSVGALAILAEEQASAGAATGVQARRQLPQSLDSLRGLACVLIVALHVVGLSSIDGLKLPDGSPWHSVMESLNLVRLPLFTAMAGFLYAAMPATRHGFGPFMTRKAQQLLVPLIFATFAFWLLRKVAMGRSDSLFWAYVDGYQHLWFLDALLLIFALVAAVDVVTPANRRASAMGAVIIGAMIAYSFMPDIPILHMKNAMFLLPFFAWGVLLYRRPELLASRMLIGASAVAAVGFLIAQQLSPETDGLFGYWGVLRWVCGGAIVIALMKVFPRIKALEWIAGFSFTIYLWHPAANATVRTVLYKLGMEATLPLFVIGLAAGVLIPIALHLVMQRFPKLLSAPIIGR